MDSDRIQTHHKPHHEVSHSLTPFTLSLPGGRLLEVDRPQVMAIVNVTPDSFYAASRAASSGHVADAVRRAIDNGADWIDIGACSTRPGASLPSAEEETARLRLGMEALRRVAPDIPVSVDTFRASVAATAVEECGADAINDISGLDMDTDMAQTVARLHVPYVLMHMRGTPATMQQPENLVYPAGVVAGVMSELQAKIERLRLAGVADIIADPGFGFAKTAEQNYELMAGLPLLHALECPLLVGISRKSMIYRTLGITPEEALPATTALNLQAILSGAAFIRVHDTREACQARRMAELLTH